jgi:hypothetical protein
LSLALGSSLSHSGFVLLALSHLKECVKETECGDDEDNEEIHDLESDVSLLLEVIPLILNISELSSI